MQCWTPCLRLPRQTDSSIVTPEPGLRDWALVVVGVAFVAMGLFILPKNPSVGSPHS